MSLGMTDPVAVGTGDQITGCPEIPRPRTRCPVLPGCLPLDLPDEPPNKGTEHGHRGPFCCGRCKWGGHEPQHALLQNIRQFQHCRKGSGACRTVLGVCGRHRDTPPRP